jgi:hypothetical protein
MKRVSINHAAIGTRYSGSATAETKDAFWERIDNDLEFAGRYEAWREAAEVGDQFPPNAVVYAARVE